MIDEKKSVNETKKINPVVYILVLIAIGLLAFNQYTIANLQTGISVTGNVAAKQTTTKSSGPISLQEAMDTVIPQGVPSYGNEIGVSYDEPVQGLAILKDFDLTYGKKPIQLTDDEMKRYINVGQQISCEFCCRAQYITAKNGRAACGCAHSAAMRGLAAYLIKNHGDEYTDEQILEELTRWKSLFFPKQMVQKYMELRAAGTGSDITALNKMPDMVGGC